jgi:hypothetical protein
VAAMDRRFARRLVALAAAYAVVLNALLPALTGIFPSAAIAAAVICSAGGARSASDDGAPKKPQPLCPGGAVCAMSGCARSGCDTSGAAVGLPDPDPAGIGAACGLAGLWHDAGQKATFWRGGGKLARGPPIA